MVDDTAPKLSLRERNRLRTRADIVRASVPLFEAQGYEGTTVDEIAFAAGVSAATFFRYFAAKEDLLFAEEEELTAALTEVVAGRENPAQTLNALADPFARYAKAVLDQDSAEMWRMTRLVMTTPTLEARSLRHRLRWERAVAQQLAKENGRKTPALAEAVTASVAVSCLVSALRFWHNGSGPHDIADLVAEAFTHAAESQVG
ncbi:probable transcriptional regulator, TetR family (plasmid) [Rhodococcus jostii RHA1]|jgi:AcrR family transcriptional regulator|uniref:Probable transcriptional regulator, TetR family n=1 Tax=Rhodococcus jostii (strain RHA1) TaxID=101510 RepID=Q0RW37_RHOJR|nr:TetR family transcriptional regulator [Rhodococcus jostii]ABH00499.1 probable transcriptional regulator, TetR family [Rhodococcus jostii RHA1]